MNISEVKFDCRHFRGELPCTPNKVSGSICTDCTNYDKITKRILIIKLGAIGDVIRTTPLVEKYRTLYPGCHITWITHTPDILPKKEIDTILSFSFTSVFTLSHKHFDIAINLDKDQEACMLLSDINAIEKYGFIWRDGHLNTANNLAEHKILTGLFDNESKINTKSYLEEIFEICGFTYNRERYLLNVNEQLVDKWSILKKEANNKKIIGLNTGCGKRWPTRLWPSENWIELIQLLQNAGYQPLLLGGIDEHEQNLVYQQKTGAKYLGTFSLEEFISITSQCDGIVTAVSMMMHIALGLGKKMILFNNIFNKHEFSLFGNGEIIEPSTGCDCYYGAKCSRNRQCMNDISTDQVFNAIQRHIP